MSNKRTSDPTLVIRLDRDETRIALISLPVIQHCTILPTPNGAVEDGMILHPELLRECLQTALAAPEFKGVHRVIFSLCSSQVISETVSVPEAFKNKLGKMLRTNMDLYFPVDVTDHHLVWRVVGNSTNEHGVRLLDVRLWAVPNSMLPPYYELANRCGLSVAAIDWYGSSLVNAVGASFSAPAPGALSDPTVTDLYLMAEREHLMMTFVRGGQVRLQRVIPCGSDPCAALIEAAIVMEYYRSLPGEYFGGDTCCTLCGRLAGESNFAQMVGQELNLPVRILPVQSGPEWCLCLGAAHAAMDFGLPSLNRPNRQKLVCGTLRQELPILAGALALVIVILLLLTSGTAWNQDLLSLRSAQQALQLRAEQTGSAAQQYRSYLSAYDQYSADWDAIFSCLHTDNDNVILLLQEVETAMPVTSRMDTLDIQTEYLNITFSCASKQDAADLILALRQLQYASLDCVSDLTAKEDSRVYFSVTLGYQDALIQAELERQGASYGDKLDPVTVAEVSE